MKKVISVIIIATLSLLLILSASSESVFLGDVNGDGRITASDARLVLRISAQLEEADSKTIRIADVDGNGKVTAADARKVLRVSAQIDGPLGSIEIEESTTAEQQTGKTEKTELISGFGMSFEKFMDKFGVLTQDETTDGTVSYSGEYIKVVSDPKMIDGGVISSIIVTGGDYCIDGVYAGMSFPDAQNMLESSRWRLSSGISASPVVFENGHGMLIKLSVSDGKVIRVEYSLSESIAETTTNEPVTDETTTKEEPTTAEEPTTKEPATKDEPTTEPENIANLPDQLKTYIYGKFGFDGDNYSYTDKEIVTNAITVYTDGDNMSLGMGMNFESGNSLDVTVLMTDINSKKSNKKYIICENTKLYCELNAINMAMMGMSADDLTVGFEPMDVTKVAVSSKTVTESGVEYTVYDVSTDDKGYTSVYMFDGEIKRLVFFQNGFQSGRIDINEFYSEIPKGKFSLNGYKKKITVFEIFGDLY